MRKISVIIPVYNVEKYIGRALDSLLAQTYKNWEAILVDDGSTDDSANIAQCYCDKDKRFIIVRQENQGQAAARNNALNMVRGDYVMYLDPDDMYHPQAMEICINAAGTCKHQGIWGHIARHACACNILPVIVKQHAAEYAKYDYKEQGQAAFYGCSGTQQVLLLMCGKKEVVRLS